MINEKNFNLEQSAAPAIGTVNAQDTMENTPACNERSSKSKLFTSFKLSRKLRIMVIEAVLMIMKKYNAYSKGMNSQLTQQDFEWYVDKTRYKKLLTKDGKANADAPDSLILRVVVVCLYMCFHIKRDEMLEALCGRNICDYEHTFEEASKAEEFRVEFSDSLSGFTQTFYDYLKELYPNAKDNAEMVKLAFSDVLMLASRFKGKFDTHLSSSGSKKCAMRYFHLDMLNFIEEQNKVLVDVFSRTASIALASMGIFDEIYCGDKDKQFVNFFEMLRDYPVALVLRLKSICSNFMNESLRLWFLEGETSEFKKVFKAFYKEINNRADKELHKAKYSVRIDAAVCLLLKFRLSFSGYGKDFNLEQASKFINSLDTVCNDLLYTSMVLIDKANRYCIHKGTYKKTVGGLAYQSVSEAAKNTVSVCPISYEHWDFKKPIIAQRDNPNAFFTLDPPYPRAFFFPCEDYKHEFKGRYFKDMLKLFKGAKCKAILFCSENIDVEDIAALYGFRLIGRYSKGENSTEVTNVFAFNISTEEKIFDPKNHGESYDVSANSQTSDGISSEKGVL